MLMPSSELLRVDPLTSCGNFLGFLESYLNFSLSASTDDIPTEAILGSSGIDRSQYSAILFVDLNNLDFLNESKGRTYGDSVLHWMGLLLAEESYHTAYRLGGDEFAVLLKMETREEYTQFMDHMLERMNREAKRLGFPESPADIALIIHDQSPANLVVMLMQMGEAMVRVKNSQDAHQMIFNASDFKISPQIPTRWNSTSDLDISYTVRF